MGLSLPHTIILLVIGLLWAVPAALILKKAGFSPAWAVACLIPPLSLVVFWTIALIPWPRRD